ncbi:hypothetical protein AB0N05_22330 [Nocardia sp. NPDC051030]|uniref:DUF7373 family lipoprotein n=1 Tax=Nocardia sp. NPDC051030 TaxID=3155162 RepID=UPI00342141D3
MTEPRKKMLSRGLGIAAAAAVAALVVTGAVVAANGSTVSGTAKAGETDVRKLDVGKYPTDPLDMRYTYFNSLSYGRQLAAMRLAGHVVTGPEIDPRFKYGNGVRAVLDADDATKILADVNAPVLERNKMQFGYIVGHSEAAVEKSGKPPASSALTKVFVMQFPDEAAAKQAAAEIDDTDFSVAADANQHVTLPNYADAHSHWRPTVPTIGSTMAHGSYVIQVFAGVKDPDLDQLTGLVEKVYKAQVPLLDSLKPLSPEDMLRLPYDPDGMMRRTLNPDGFGMPDNSTQAVFELRGFLHQTKDQEYWTRLTNETGVDRFSFSSAMSSAAMLFRTRDTPSALKLASVVLDKQYPGVADAPPGIPDAKCGESLIKNDYSTKRFRCAVTYRQYVATVEGDQLADAQQRASAQYALLANSTW